MKKDPTRVLLSYGLNEVISSQVGAESHEQGHKDVPVRVAKEQGTVDEPGQADEEGDVLLHTATEPSRRVGSTQPASR